MDTSQILNVLLAWAVHLSGYPAPDQPPELQFEPHNFFVERVCGGKECRALGWYNDQGIVYIDERYRDADSSFAASLIVHELVHYLQHLSGKFESHSCADSVAREREAYFMQNEYLMKGQASIAFIRPGRTYCGYKNQPEDGPPRGAAAAPLAGDELD